MHGAGCVRQCFRTAEPLRERCYDNWNTHKADNYPVMVTVVTAGVTVAATASIKAAL